MKSLLSTLTLIVAVLYFGRMAVSLWLLRDMLANVRTCNAELHMQERERRDLSRAEVDTLYDQLGTCLDQKSNWVGRLFGAQKATRDWVEETRAERHAHGPPAALAPH